MARHHLPYKIRRLAPHLLWVDVPTPPMGEVEAKLTVEAAQVHVSMRKMWPNYGGGMQPCHISPIFRAQVIIQWDWSGDCPMENVCLTLVPTREIEDAWDALLHMVYVVHPGVWSALAAPPIVTNDPARYIKRGDLVTTNDAIYLDRDAPGQPDRMTFANLDADADGYVTAKHDPT